MTFTVGDGGDRVQNFIKLCLIFKNVPLNKKTGMKMA
jgi:hypothetical protein